MAVIVTLSMPDGVVWEEVRFPTREAAAIARVAEELGCSWEKAFLTLVDEGMEERTKARAKNLS